MDILHLIDRLEAMVMDSPRLPVVGKILLDPQEMLDLVDSMRLAVPESIKEVERTRGRSLTPSRMGGFGSQDYGDTRVETSLAPTRANRDFLERYDDDDPLIDDARRKAERILTEAENQAAEIRAGADEYAYDVLTRLEEQLTNMATTVQRGIELLELERGNR